MPSLTCPRFAFSWPSSIELSVGRIQLRNVSYSCVDINTTSIVVWVYIKKKNTEREIERKRARERKSWKYFYSGYPESELRVVLFVCFAFFSPQSLPQLLDGLSLYKCLQFCNSFRSVCTCTHHSHSLMDLNTHNIMGRKVSFSFYKAGT